MDDIQQRDTQPISDDQDLAKALAGINEAEASNDMDFTGAPPVVADINAQIAASDISAEPTAATPPVVAPAPSDITIPDVEVTNEEVSSVTMPAEPVTEAEVYTPPELADILPTIPSSDNSTDDLLDPIKSQALNELRPLVDKLNLPADEKFETYLLLIRNSDDKTLIAPAHQTALKIEDETKRAEALLDIIKEIEYLSNPEE